MARAVGCCGFLSFSLVFCKFGGRLETTLYIHFIRNWVKARRHSSARREDEKKAKKNAILRNAERRVCGVVGAPRRASPAPSRRLTRRGPGRRRRGCEKRHSVAHAGDRDVVTGSRQRGGIRYARGPVRAGDRQLDRSAEKRPRRSSAPPAA